MKFDTGALSNPSDFLKKANHPKGWDAKQGG